VRTKLCVKLDFLTVCLR